MGWVSSIPAEDGDGEPKTIPIRDEDGFWEAGMRNHIPVPALPHCHV